VCTGKTTRVYMCMMTCPELCISPYLEAGNAPLVPLFLQESAIGVARAGSRSVELEEVVGIWYRRTVRTGTAHVVAAATPPPPAVCCIRPRL